MKYNRHSLEECLLTAHAAIAQYDVRVLLNMLKRTPLEHDLQILMATLATDPVFWEVRSRLAERSDITFRTQQRLLYDAEPDVRKALASNPATELGFLKIMSREDSNTDVQEAAKLSIRARRAEADIKLQNFIEEYLPKNDSTE